MGAWTSYLRIPFSDPHDGIAGVFEAERARDWLAFVWGPHNAQRIPVALALQALDIEAVEGRAPTFLLGSAAAWLLGCAAVLVLIGRSRAPGAPNIVVARPRISANFHTRPLCSRLSGLSTVASRLR